MSPEDFVTALELRGMIPDEKKTLVQLCFKPRTIRAALERVREWDRRFPIRGGGGTAAATTTATTATIPPVGTPAPAATGAVAAAEAEAATTNATATTESGEQPDPDSDPEPYFWTEERIRVQLLMTHNYTGAKCLHLILNIIGDTWAPELLDRLVRRFESYGEADAKSVFLAEWKGRTPVHMYPAWWYANRGVPTPPGVLQRMVRICPEATFRRDSKYKETPFDISDMNTGPNSEESMILATPFAKQLGLRSRICLRLCAGRLFPKEDNNDDGARGGGGSSSGRSGERFVPFDENDRRRAGVDPGPWFVASVLGDCLRNDREHLAARLVSFLGFGALEVVPLLRREARKRQFFWHPRKPVVLPPNQKRKVHTRPVVPRGETGIHPKKRRV